MVGRFHQPLPEHGILQLKTCVPTRLYRVELEVPEKVKRLLRAPRLFSEAGSGSRGPTAAPSATSQTSGGVPFRHRRPSPVQGESRVGDGPLCLTGAEWLALLDCGLQPGLTQREPEPCSRVIGDRLWGAPSCSRAWCASKFRKPNKVAMVVFTRSGGMGKEGKDTDCRRRQRSRPASTPSSSVHAPVSSAGLPAAVRVLLFRWE